MDEADGARLTCREQVAFVHAAVVDIACQGARVSIAARRSRGLVHKRLTDGEVTSGRALRVASRRGFSPAGKYEEGTISGRCR